nr:hypothetical protein [uncultured Dysosmobacter sp.]
MTEPWLVFYHQGKELLAYTLRGTFPGERQDTIALLAAERGIDPAEITTKTENRRTGK